MTTASSLPRGLRNRNPGNLRSGSELWLGQTGAVSWLAQMAIERLWK